MLGWRAELAWDVGFQLSFAGTAAIVLLTPGIERRLRWLPHLLREPFAVTCAAQVGTLPMMAADFHVLSPVAPIANAAVLPLLPALVAGGLLLAPLAWLPDPGPGRLVALPLVGLLAYLAQVAMALARVPAAAIGIPSFPAWAGAAYYAGLGGAIAALRSRGRTRAAAAALAVGIPVLIGAGEVAASGAGPPSATVLAVGEGQAVLLSGPAGAILIDGGPSPSRLSSELGQHLPFWQRRLDALVVTDPGLGHVAGLAGLPYPADLVITASPGRSGAAQRAAVLRQVALGARSVPVQAGREVSVAGFRLQFLAPEPDDPGDEPGAGALAVRAVSSTGRSFCDLSDLDPQAQAAAARRLAGTCDHLLVPGGGRSSLAPELTRAAGAPSLVASVGSGRLAREIPAARVLRTDQEGSIVLRL
jgi:competence protein ComEC